MGEYQYAHCGEGLKEAVDGPIAQGEVVLLGEQKECAHMMFAHGVKEILPLGLFIVWGMGHDCPRGVQTWLIGGEFEDALIAHDGVVLAREAVQNEGFTHADMVHIGKKVRGSVGLVGLQPHVTAQQAVGVEQLVGRRSRIHIDNSMIGNTESAQRAGA